MFDPSTIAIFRAYTRSGTAPTQIGDPGYTYTEDTSATYAMTDAALLAEALEGLTSAQQTVVNAYRYTPTAADYEERRFLQWAGDDPVAVYFKVPGTAAQQTTKLRSALAKRWREPSQ